MRSLTMLSIVMAFAFAGCGSHDVSTLFSGKPSRPEKVLLVVMGGNTSCVPDSDGRRSPLLMDMHAPFAALHKSLEDSGRFLVDYLLTCHDSDATVHLTASDDKDRIIDTDFAGAQEKIDDLFAASSAERLILAGHSYGGWLAMKSAAVLKERLDTLITIDPISRVKCTILTPAGCVSSPSDIRGDELAAIRANSGRWANFWQKKTLYLHSSPISEADENVEERVGHTSIDTVTNVWSRVARAVELSLQVSPRPEA